MDFFNFDHLRNYTSEFRPHLRHKILTLSPSTHLLPPSSSYSWLLIMVSLFLTHLLLEVASPIIFLPSPFRCHDLQEAKDSIDEEDPRPTSSTWNYITLDDNGILKVAQLSLDEPELEVVFIVIFTSFIEIPHNTIKGKLKCGTLQKMNLVHLIIIIIIHISCPHVMCFLILPCPMSISCSLSESVLLSSLILTLVFCADIFHYLLFLKVFYSSRESRLYGRVRTRMMDAFHYGRINIRSDG